MKEVYLFRIDRMVPFFKMKRSVPVDTIQASTKKKGEWKGTFCLCLALVLANFRSLSLSHSLSLSFSHSLSLSLSHSVSLSFSLTLSLSLALSLSLSLSLSLHPLFSLSLSFALSLSRSLALFLKEVGLKTHLFELRCRFRMLIMKIFKQWRVWLCN